MPKFKEVLLIKGYPTQQGYMGYIPHEGYVLFSCEQDYIETYNELEGE